MKVVMVHDEEECEKECTATVPCIAFTFISGMEICALKAPKDAVTLVPAGGGMISGSLDGERPGVEGKALDEPICLSCLPGFSIPTHQRTASYAFLSSLQRRGGYKVLWPQLVPTGCRDPGGMCSSLSSGARVQLLDAQPKHWQVLAEEVRPGKNGLDKRLKLWTKVLWCNRWTED